VILPLVLSLSKDAHARPHRAASANDPMRTMPMRIVLEQRGVRWANCIFGTREIAEQTPPDTRTQTQFDDTTPIWGRCYLPDPFATRAGDFVDHISVDGKPLAEQPWDRVAKGAWSRSVPYGALLRSALAALPPGGHMITVEGALKHGGKRLKLYEGEFRYVR
jgi:hypothetical protein